MRKALPALPKEPDRALSPEKQAVNEAHKAQHKNRMAAIKAQQQAAWKRQNAE